MSESTTTRVQVLNWPVIFEGTTYQPGEEVELPAAQAKRLFDRGKVAMVGELTVAEEEAEPAPKKPAAKKPAEKPAEGEPKPEGPTP